MMVISSLVLNITLARNIGPRTSDRNQDWHIHSFIQPIFVSSYYVPGTVLGTEVAAMNAVLASVVLIL